MEKQESLSKKVDLSGKTGQIVLPTIDVQQYIGKKARIETVEEFEGSFGYYIKCTTAVIDERKDIKDKEGKPLALRASKIFSLQTDSSGGIGWGEETKLGLYLKKLGVKHYNDLKGREVVVQSMMNKEGDKEYLTFN